MSNLKSSKKRISSFVDKKMSEYQDWTNEALNKEEAVNLSVGYIMILTTILTAIQIKKDGLKTSDEVISMIDNIVKNEIKSSDENATALIKEIFEDMEGWRI